MNVIEICRFGVLMDVKLRLTFKDACPGKFKALGSNWQLNR